MATAVYGNMAAAAQDTLQQLLVKACYWAQSAAGAGPFPDGMYPNMSPFAQDTVHDLTAKLAYWLQQVSGGGGGGGSGSAFTVGTGSPEGVVSGSPGDRFWASDTGFEWTKVTGVATTTGWLVH
jgi:hypothetical protein